MIDEKASAEARTILIAEDSSVQAEQLRYILENHGYQVVVAVDGMEASLKAQQIIPDLIISDIVMPRMNGYELCKTIKSNEQTLHIPVILLTSLSNPDDLIDGLASGASNFLTKPFQEEYLLSQINEVFLNKELYSGIHEPVTMELARKGEKLSVTTDPQQILTLLMSSYHAAIQRNEELTTSQDELRNINDRLEDLVDERTTKLQEEIAERQKIQEELAHSLSLIEATLESTVDGILVVDLEGRILKTNKKFIDLFAIPDHILRTKDDRKAVEYVLSEVKNPEAFIQKIESLYQNITEESRDYIEFQDGRVYERYSRPQVVGKDVIGRVWSFWDVTERIKAEIDLRESEQRLGLALKASDLGMWDWQISSKSFWQSKRYNQIFGHRGEDQTMHPNDVLEQVWPDDRPLVKEKYQEALQSGKLHADFRITWPSGEMRWVSLFGKTQYDDHNHPIRMLGTIQDITERKFNELEIKIANEELRKANADKDRLFSIIAHDLRSPFNGFIGLTDIMLENALELKPSELHEISKRLNSSAKNIYDLLENLLEWSLIQKQKGQLNTKSFDLSELVVQNIEVIREKAVQKGIGVINEIPNDQWVIGDKKMLNTVIRNLFSNAIKFTKSGGMITLSSAFLDNQWVEVAVVDTGVGMSLQQLQNIQQSGGTSGTSGTDGEKSTGLGLMLCKEFVEQNGGSLRVESTQGEGSEFYFTVPVDRTKMSKEVNQPKQVVAVDNKKNNLNILIAEDDEASQMLLKLAVQSFGKEILVANDGVEAVEACRNNPGIDLVLMDIKMPRMDGKEATNQIRKFNKNLIIVAQSAYADSSDIELILKLGFTDFIAKPINIKVLQDVIEKYFGNLKVA